MMDKLKNPVHCGQDHRIAEGQFTKTEQYENYVKSGGNLSFREYYSAKYSAEHRSDKKSVK